MEDFDRKLSETDAYLQMLIDQNAVFIKKVKLARTVIVSTFYSEDFQFLFKEMIAQVSN